MASCKANTSVFSGRNQNKITVKKYITHSSVHLILPMNLHAPLKTFNLFMWKGRRKKQNNSFKNHILDPLNKKTTTFSISIYRVGLTLPPITSVSVKKIFLILLTHSQILPLLWEGVTKYKNTFHGHVKGGGVNPSW